MTKRALAADALTRIGAMLASAPARPTYRRPFTPTEILQVLLGEDGTWLQTDVPDPSGTGCITICVICSGEPHDAGCPVGVLETLAHIGVDTPTPMPITQGFIDRISNNDRDHDGA